MLSLKGITKNYLSGENQVQALKGIDIEFRKSEFVSILGQSGCGKTTLLNIIGGLDRYTSGDLIINGKSTKKFKDRDWDAYRNYSVGFVFQSYNLIPHQTVLSNVELALTISGVSREERKARAIKALEEVGLKDQIYKKPNQMSGGQMQRVAIARALVNDPDIILADEPTGALDTKTSVQVMEILKKISKDKLIIMVTHNPELAEKYSSRVIKLLDGKITDDSNPYNSENEEKVEAKTGKTAMSFLTALSLSLNNLMTKKGRTFLTAFAGSIGIIGIALIMSLSNGIQTYINKVEEDTLSLYPITIEEATIDVSSMMNTLMGENQDTTNREENKIYSREIMGDMLSTVSTKIQTNNLKDFKQYLESEGNKIAENSNSIQYNYNLDIKLYKENTDNGIVQVNPSTVMKVLGMQPEDDTQQAEVAMSYTSTDVWQELLDNKDVLKSQYDVISGNWPTAYNEVVLIVDENNEISDYTLYSLGIKDQNELKEKYQSMLKGNELEKTEVESFSYDDLLNLKFKLLLNTDYYEKQNNIWQDKSNDETYMKEKIANAEEIKVVGIIKPNEEAIVAESSGLIGYTKELKEYVINKVNNSQIVKEQRDNETINVFTGLQFSDETNSASGFNYNELTDEQKAYMSTLSDEELANLMSSYSQNASGTYETNLKKLGAVDLDSPSSLNIYPKDFESKETIQNAIEEYNEQQRNNGKEENVINYTDMVGIMMSSVTSIVDVISNVLIAFVAISLIVSSIMIGIITYISVLERTKEIGILRSIGASKKDISRVFNAETFIVGIVAGLLGIGITLLLNIPINIVIKAITNISGIAKLPVQGGAILVIISVLLTMVAGLIPAKFAAKRDPVEALRTE